MSSTQKLTPELEDCATSSWPRGSEWRKWDLHVHSPASSGYTGTWEQFVIQLGSADCDVIGINDYFSVAGYKEVMRRLQEPDPPAGNSDTYLKALEALRNKTLFPVVECRMNNVLIGKGGTGPSPRVNFHLIFSNDIDPSDIETFICGLMVQGKSIGSRIEDKDFLKNQVSVNFEEVKLSLENDETYAGKYLIWIPYDEYGGIDPIDPDTDAAFKRGLVKSADVLGSSRKAQIDFFLWRGDKFKKEQYREWFGKKKPCIKGSDSHTAKDEVGKLKDHNSQPINKHCWIKADPTFEGLSQIVHEPEERVWIGTVPPKLDEARKNPTRFIDSITIAKKQSSKTGDTWFDCTIPLNQDMVAIIGDKGTGKSALADIIGLVGNTHCDPEYFSFLKSDRFCEKNGRIARDFQATLTWNDGQSSVVDLDQIADKQSTELLKYIPQQYLERICTEKVAGEESAFQTELRKVIFSHIEPHERLGKASLDELIFYKSEELRSRVQSQRIRLRKVNVELVSLSEIGGASNIASLKSKIGEKERELTAHTETKPNEISKPQNISEEQKLVLQQVESSLAGKRGQLTSLDAELAVCVVQREAFTGQRMTSEKLKARLGQLRSVVEDFASENRDDFQSLGIDVDSIVSLQIDQQPLDSKETEVAEKLMELSEKLDPESSTGLISQKTALTEEIASLQNTLDLPNQEYQKYLQLLQAWEAKRNEIVGNTSQEGSLENLKAQLSYAEVGVIQDLSSKRLERETVAREIHQTISSIRALYDELFSPVQTLISDGLLAEKGFDLSFSSEIADQGFRKEFFGKYVNQGVTGSFCGKESGRVILDALMSECDFDSDEESLGFLTAVERHLDVDMRSPDQTPTEISSQLKKGATVGSLYDYLWSLEYLEPEYSLTLDGKGLAQLSPGERGTLLLVFYLLVDKSEAPIVVDQPEENLDSKTVYRLLIPVIKTIKAKRQVIMVTHSPNIAVVCDAEQVIHASIERTNKNRVLYEHGAIESKEMNKYLIDVLEGTRPAFENRGSKYFESS